MLFAKDILKSRVMGFDSVTHKDIESFNCIIFWDGGGM